MEARSRPTSRSARLSSRSLLCPSTLRLDHGHAAGRRVPSAVSSSRRNLRGSSCAGPPSPLCPSPVAAARRGIEIALSHCRTAGRRKGVYRSKVAGLARPLLADQELVRLLGVTHFSPAAAVSSLGHRAQPVQNSPRALTRHVAAGAPGKAPSREKADLIRSALGPPTRRSCDGVALHHAAHAAHVGHAAP